MLRRDFTLERFSELLKSLPNGNYTLQGALENNCQFGIIRHDVDRPPKNLIRLAQLEHNQDIKATYYFRVKKNHFKPEVITKVKELGHEVGYHYEVIDKAKGNIDKAIEIFKQEWKLFSKWNSRTICMHGNPLSKYDNKDIWKQLDFQHLNILGEGYLSIDFSKYLYFTDTGRKWNYDHFSIKDKVNEKIIKIKSTKELIKKIKSNEIKNIYILAHPSKWNNNWFLWIKELIFQNLKNVFKYLLSKQKKTTRKK